MNEDDQPKVLSLAAQIEAVGEMVTKAAASCTVEQWRTMMPEEGRTVGVVFHHIADSFPYVTDWAVTLASGWDLPPVNYERVNEHNRRHAEKNSAVSQADTLALLRQNSSAASGQIRSLTDEQLEMTAPFELVGGKDVTGEQIVEWFLVSHANNHLEAIKATLNPD